MHIFKFIMCPLWFLFTSMNEWIGKACEYVLIFLTLLFWLPFFTQRTTDWCMTCVGTTNSVVTHFSWQAHFRINWTNTGFVKGSLCMPCAFMYVRCLCVCVCARACMYARGSLLSITCMQAAKTKYCWNGPRWKYTTPSLCLKWNKYESSLTLSGWSKCYWVPLPITRCLTCHFLSVVQSS